MKIEIPLIADIDVPAEDADDLRDDVRAVVHLLLVQRDPNSVVKLKPVRIVS